MRHGAVALLTATLLAVPSVATAGADLAISELEVDDRIRSVDLVLTAGEPGNGLDPATVLATVGDRQLPTTSVTAAGSSSTEPPIVLLVVDTSGSMVGQPMQDAKAAISTFVAQAPVDVGLGLLAFSSTPRMLVTPTLDRARVIGAVSGLQAQGETALYDATLAGLAAVNGDRDYRLVVLSDGGDTRSRGSLEQVLRTTRSKGALVDVIGFNTDESVDEVLKRIAAEGRGRVHAASSSAELATALSSSVREHPSALSVRVAVPRDLRGDRTLQVSVEGATGKLTASTPVTLGSAIVPAPSASGWWDSKRALLAGLAGIAASLLLGSFALLGGGQRDRRRTHDVLSRFTTAPAPVKEDLRTASPVTRTALSMAEKVVTRRGLTDRLTLKLDRAAVAMTPAEWILLQTGAAFGLTLLLVLLGWNLLLALLVGNALAILLPSTFLKLRGGRRQKSFSDKLPDALQMAAGSLSAGYSLAQALDGIVREGSEPMATEIGRALAESRLGVPVETTLEGVAVRMDSRDFSWVVMAIRVQREVGGNLAGILTTVAATMRERAMLRRHVRGLSAEGRLSAYILIGLPVFLAFYMLTLRREYIEPLYTTGLGIGLIAAALLLLSFGSFVMSRMVKVEV